MGTSNCKERRGITGIAMMQAVNTSLEETSGF
jgi:hypothetical protein